jgi:uncharacterized membrane protein YjfL (UPF0719 family)
VTSSLYFLGFGVATTLGLLLVFVAAQRLVSPADTFRASAGAKPGEHGSAARALVLVGNVLAIFLIASSIVAGSVQGQSLRQDVTWVAAYGAAALVLFIAFAKLGELVLVKSRLPSELARGNVAAGLAAGSHAVATGIIVARAIAGTGLRGLGVSAIFFLLAQVSFYLLTTLFRWLTSYDDEEEIIGENLAAAFSYSGCAIGVALLVGHAVEGQFVGWAKSLQGYGFALVFGLLFYPVRQLLVEGLFLRARPSLYGGALDQAIGRDRNVGVGALEAIAYVATALAIGRIAG